MSKYADERTEARPFSGRVFGYRGAIATEHYLSAEAGMEMFRRGGNAFDAAVAAAFVEGVVNPHMHTVGGECPMIVYSARDGKVVSVNGNTEAPAAATLEAYLARGLALIPGQGAVSAGVPAAFSALSAVLERYGTLSLPDVMEPARDLAENGFPAYEGLISQPWSSITRCREQFLSHWPGSAAVYLKDGGRLPEVGERLVNPALAATFTHLSDVARRAGREGRESGIRAAVNAFYCGDIAREMAAWSKQNDGFIEMADLSRFETRFEEPASVAFHDTVVYKCGPWSQGPVLLQMLTLLEGYDLAALGHNSAEYLHLWLEAAKLAFADREQFYADPAHVEVPLPALLSPEYAALRRALIDPRRASRDHRPGDPRRMAALLPEKDAFRLQSWGYGTVHVAAADAEGNLAALTPSGGWISGNEVIPALGFPLGTRLQTFYLDASHPNRPAPRKRPRTTLTPGVAFRGGKPWMAFGTMGGDGQDQWLCQFFLNRAVFGMTTPEAIEAAKVTSEHCPNSFFPHDAHPAALAAENRIPAAVLDDLAARGHIITTVPGWAEGFVCAASLETPDTLEAGADPRGRKTAVFPSTALAW